MDHFIREAPEITEAIECDLDAHAREKKLRRIQDRNLKMPAAPRRWTAARSELTEKVLAYNFCRVIEIRGRKEENLQRTG